MINNACFSWHRLAGDMTFVGARAYVLANTSETELQNETLARRQNESPFNSENA